MLIKYAGVCAIALNIFGCSKANDEPAVPVINFFHAINSEDSAEMVHAMSAEFRMSFLRQWREADPVFKAKGLFSLTKGSHQEVEILRVVLNNEFPDSARVYVFQTVTGTIQKGPDSLYYTVIKEGGDWKLADPEPAPSGDASAPR